jgi:hypothetical protein
MPKDTGEMPEQEAQATDAAAQDTTEQFDFDSWLDGQPEHVKQGFTAKTTGLHSALESERTQRKDLAKELKKLSGEATQGSEAQKALGEMSTQLERAEQRAAFMEEGVRPEIGCTNLKAAFLVASADGLFKRSGEPDWAAIKQAAPELFGQRKTPPGNAGSGNGSPPAEKASMNDWIRKAARGG